MEPLLLNLEGALSSSKSKLKQEQTLRRQAELAQVEMEARHQEAESNLISLRDDNEALRSECDTAHEETAFKCSELYESNEEKAKYMQQLEELKTRLGDTELVLGIQRKGASGPDQSGSSATITSGDYTSGVVSNRTPASSHMDESHLEILDELENVTEQFITTQQKLWKTEDYLRDSETKIRGLEVRLGMNEGGDLDSDEACLLRDELSILRDEYSVTADELCAAEEQAEKYKDMLDEMQGSSQIQKVAQLEVDEVREENSCLVEEIACLREALRSKADGQKNPFLDLDEETREMKETISKEVRATVMKEAKVQREREINVLREKFKIVFKENAILQEKVDKAQTKCEQAGDLNESSKYKEQIARLSTAFKQAKEEHKSIVNELEI